MFRDFVTMVSGKADFSINTSGEELIFTQHVSFLLYLVLCKIHQNDAFTSFLGNSFTLGGGLLFYKLLSKPNT